MNDTRYLQLIRFVKKRQKFSRLLPHALQIKAQSHLRTQFIHKLQNFGVSKYIENAYSTSEAQTVSSQLAKLDNNPVTVLGLNFRHNLYNAAGIFKSTEGYDFVNSIKAGAFTFGTTTANPRAGNHKNTIKHPFVSLEESQVALNFLGLPNAGDESLSKYRFNDKDKNCPVIVSVMRSPDYEGAVAMDKLLQSLWLYHENPTIDMIEINESCPNVKASIDDVTDRLKHIKEHFLDKRSRHLPVVIKLSNLIEPEHLKEITTELINLHFDGIIVGNTVTNYAHYTQYIAKREKALYEYFTKQFGGGLSGKVLKQTSLNNVEIVANVVEQLQPAHEFAIIRCGGIYNASDLHDSEQYGVSLNQWYTGFIDCFLHNDVKVYTAIKNSSVL